MMCCPMAAQEVGPATGRPMVTRVAARLRRHDGMDPGAAGAADARDAAFFAGAADARDAAFFAGARALLALAPLVFSYQIS